MCGGKKGVHAVGACGLQKVVDSERAEDEKVTNCKTTTGVQIASQEGHDAGRRAVERGQGASEGQAESFHEND